MGGRGELSTHGEGPSLSGSALVVGSVYPSFQALPTEPPKTSRDLPQKDPSAYPIEPFTPSPSHLPSLVGAGPQLPPVSGLGC